jgi:hypothetical protein
MGFKKKGPYCLHCVNNGIVLETCILSVSSSPLSLHAGGLSSWFSISFRSMQLATDSHCRPWLMELLKEKKLFHQSHCLLTFTLGSILTMQLSNRSFINSAKRNIPFSGPCLSKIIYKNPNNFTDLHCKGFKHCFHACSMNHKQFMNMHPWNGR